MLWVKIEAIKIVRGFIRFHSTGFIFYSVFLAMVLKIHKKTPKRKNAPGAIVKIDQFIQACGITFNPKSVPKPMGSLISAIKSRSEERRVGKECRSRWSP